MAIFAPAIVDYAPSGRWPQDGEAGAHVWGDGPEKPEEDVI